MVMFSGLPHQQLTTGLTGSEKLCGGCIIQDKFWRVGRILLSKDKSGGIAGGENETGSSMSGLGECTG